MGFTLGVGPVSAGISIAVLLVGGALFLPAQRAISASKAKSPTPHKTTKTEILIIVLGFVVLVGSIAIYFWPHANTRSTLSPRANELKARAAALNASYDQCASKLQDQYKILDTSNQEAVDGYNTNADACEHIRAEQNQTADDYNKLVGIKE